MFNTYADLLGPSGLSLASALQAEQKKKGGAVKNKKLMTAEERDKARDEAGLKPLKRSKSRRASPGLQTRIQSPLESAQGPRASGSSRVCAGFFPGPRNRRLDSGECEIHF